jgi:hypothetical protein
MDGRAVGVSAVYGGYFGARLSVVLLVVLGLVVDDTLPQLNALKQTVSFSTNTAISHTHARFSRAIGQPLVNHSS